MCEILVEAHFVRCLDTRLCMQRFVGLRAELVTRDAMIGTGLALSPEAVR